MTTLQVKNDTMSLLIFVASGLIHATSCCADLSTLTTVQIHVPSIMPDCCGSVHIRKFHYARLGIISLKKKLKQQIIFSMRENKGRTSTVVEK